MTKQWEVTKTEAQERGFGFSIQRVGFAPADGVQFAFTTEDAAREAERAIREVVNAAFDIAVKWTGMPPSWRGTLIGGTR